MNSAVNPFIHGKVISPENLVGRDKEIRRLCSRLATGQSTAVVGMPHIGKTSLIKCLEDVDFRRSCVGELLSDDTFSYLDVQTLRGIQNQKEFWRLALMPLKQRLSTEEGDLSSVVNSYELAKSNDFGSAILQQFFSSLSRAGARLILVLDEFDDFLTHSVLNSAEFYGGLRSLVSLSQGLVVVLATRKELDQLNELTQAINPHGSPYFNVFTEIRLGALPKSALQNLLDRGDGRFGRQDHKFISAVSGLHPYLVQSAAAMLWEAYEEGYTGTECYAQASQDLYQQSKKHFGDCWRSWTNETKKAITVIALNQIPQMTSPHTFLFPELTENLSDYTPELERLEASGFLEENKDGVWIIKQGAFIWWLADELRRNIRDATEFRAWLQAQELDGILTKKEREHIGGAIRASLSKIGKGGMTLIETFAKGLGEVAVKQLGR